MCRIAGAANARLAVFAGTTSSDLLLYCLPGQILRICVLGEKTNWLIRAFRSLERYADPFAVCPDDAAMLGANPVVDRQLKDPRQPKGTCNVKTRAGRGQVLNGT
jgi:hypothetical protein